MKTCTCLTVWRGFFFVLFCASLCLPTLSWAAVGFTLNPSSVSNTYGGTITLQVTGLTNTETVVVQTFLDANTNGVIDGADLLVQQFSLTDGQASVMGGHYPSGGINLGPAMTFGFVAGRHAAGAGAK